MKHGIEVRQIGKYAVCRSCLRGIALVKGEWFHVRRTSWKGDAQ